MEGLLGSALGTLSSRCSLGVSILSPWDLINANAEAIRPATIKELNPSGNVWERTLIHQPSPSPKPNSRRSIPRIEIFLNKPGILSLLSAGTKEASHRGLGGTQACRVGSAWGYRGLEKIVTLWPLSLLIGENRREPLGADMRHQGLICLCTGNAPEACHQGALDYHLFHTSTELDNGTVFGFEL